MCAIYNLASIMQKGVEIWLKIPQAGTLSGKAYGMEEDALGGGGGIISGGLKIGGKVEVGGLRLKKFEDTPLHGSRVSLKIFN